MDKKAGLIPKVSLSSLTMMMLWSPMQDHLMPWPDLFGPGMVEVRPLARWLLQGQGMAGVRPLTWTMTIARLGWLYMFERLDKAGL